MSHSQTINIQVTNAEALKAAALEVEAQDHSAEERDIKMFDGKTFRGMFVHFKGWRYPVVFNRDGAHHDNYNGAWGNEADLHKFNRSYASNVILGQARLEGRTILNDRMEGDRRILSIDNGDGSTTEATVGLDGNAVLDVVGCAGNACVNHTAGISAALGVSLGSEFKPEHEEREQLREREQE